MDKTKYELRKARRNKSEQFRKSRNNFFHRGHDICLKSEAKMLVLIERKGRYYRFMSSDCLLDIPEEEIAAKLAMSKTSEDFNRAEKAGGKKKKKRDAPSLSASHRNSATATLRGEAPIKLEPHFGGQDGASDFQTLPSFETVLERIKALGRPK